MGEVAWPFLIGRTKTEDHRFVVIPEFMTDAALATALRAKVTGDPMEPGSAAVREIQIAQGRVITVVYRVSIARAEAYGIPGTGVLTDSHGRPILITEGLVLCRAASDVMTSGVARATLDQAHALVAPVYREFWSAERQFVRQAGHACPVASTGSPGVHLRYRPDAPASASVPRSPEPATAGTGPAVVLAPADEPQPSAWPPHERVRSRGAARGVIVIVSVLAILVLVTAGWLAVKYFTKHPASRDAAQTMSAFCADLQAGHPDAAYALTTTSYQARTKQSAFTSELLPQGIAATQCKSAAQDPQDKTTANATIAVTQGKPPGSWLVTLTGSTSTRWQIAAINPDLRHDWRPGARQLTYLRFLVFG
jgi:hypothetical protein